jgi:hypothetical protein
MTKIISSSAFGKLLTSFWFSNLHHNQVKKTKNRNEYENLFACHDLTYFIHNLG